MTVPSWYELALLALAAFRMWKLLAEDTILDKPRRYVTGKALELLECPWCAGFWISLAWWGGWQASPHWSLVAAAPLAISALLVAAERLISGPS